jgi:predicted amidohydrolase
VQPLTVTLVQTPTRWHDAAANRTLFDRRLRSLPDATRLVVLPEMFASGFTMDARAVAEPMDGPTVTWLRDTAARSGRTLCGSLVIEEAGTCYNRWLWATPAGGLTYYDKRHRFRMAGEHLSYGAGAERVVVALDGWRILPLVCYDLRFPVWSRNRGDYDLLLVVANWPAARQHAWETLLRARAIENLVYVAGVNVIGRDGNAIEYRGGSTICGPEGETLVDAGAADGLFSATLDPEHLARYRERFPAWQDADDFRLLPE